MTNSVRSLSAAAFALFLVAATQVSNPTAQQQADTASAQQQVVTTYRPAGKRVSPQDGFAATRHSPAPTPRDADGHPDLTGNWGANFPSPLGAPGIRKMGTREPDQAVMQRGAQWNKPLYKPEY